MGCIITPSNDENIQDMEYNEIVFLFERYGTILFRGFGFPPEKITTVTDRYTERYSGEAQRRPSRYGQKVVHDVAHQRYEYGKGSNRWCERRLA